jgi:predicted lipid carrier protein YhbT
MAAKLYALSDEDLQRLAHIEEQLAELRTLVAHQVTPAQLMPLAAAAKALSISLKTLRRRLADGTWPSYQEGRIIKVDVQEIRARMRRQPNTQGVSHALRRRF